MLTKNSDVVMELLKPTDTVLDIGGWALAFNRANYVMDSGSYESRDYYNRTFAKNHPFPLLGGSKEYFSKDSWIQRDICDKAPFPFRDKEIDYVICSHTLEDIRDPLWVCSEMIRVAKRGYVEVPSRVWETCRGSERGVVGLSHHRWLIDITGNRIDFLMKFHGIHGNWKYSFPARYLRGLSEERKVQWLFWNDTFEFSETTIHGLEEQHAELEQFVTSVRPYSSITTGSDKLINSGVEFTKRGLRFARRKLIGSGRVASRRPPAGFSPTQ
jgi:hypothetical protein